MELEENQKRVLLNNEAKQNRKGDDSTNKKKNNELGWESFRNDPKKQGKE